MLAFRLAQKRPLLFNFPECSLNFPRGNFRRPLQAVPAEKLAVRRRRCGYDRAEGRFVGCLYAKFLMGQPQMESGGRGFAGGIAKHIAAQGGQQCFFIEHVGVPGQSRTGGEQRPTYGKWLRMTTVAPIRVKEAERAELFAGLSGGAKVGQRVVVAADHRLPGRGAGADIKRNFGAGKLRRFFGKRMIGLVAPVQGDDIFWQRANEGRILQNDVAPEHHGSFACRYFAVDFFDKVEIDLSLAPLGALFFALALAEVPGLVGPDVKKSAGKIWQQFVEQLAHKWQGAGVGRCQRGGPAEKIFRLRLVRLSQFSQFF